MAQEGVIDIPALLAWSPKVSSSTNPSSSTQREAVVMSRQVRFPLKGGWRSPSAACHAYEVTRDAANAETLLRRWLNNGQHYLVPPLQMTVSL
ncbi:hypothetical protein Nepgr_009483 [Nepenthes gracilis]|uniref:Uncharacterized protein n=1 Tax=Nepenthes gracilis TaxID=150966 RepID=A0AAD3SAL2_NEPGR|nr:hypothetical protein Nepgr_009483 [Nepenthes gracilis]